MDVRVRLLGRFELTCDGVVAIDGAWKPAKAAAIIKILALRSGRSMHRDQLIALLWPEADPEAGTNSLYKNLHQLRRTVRRAGGPRDVIHLEHPLISLAPYVLVDTDELRQRAAELDANSSREELASVLAIGGGASLLPEDLYEPWTEPHRAEIALQTTRLRMQLANLHLQSGAFDEAAEQYRAVLVSDDLSEEAHLGLMRAYAGADRRDLALRQYERCKEILASELGAAPSEEMESLVADIRRANAKGQIAEAIEEPIREGDAAMRRLAYTEAMERYRAAIQRLQAEGDDEREARLWLKLATATSAAGTSMEVAECCRRAATLAEHAGASELEARALVQFQSATDATPDNHAGHREAAELIQAALDRLPTEPSAARAMLLAASARPLAASARSDNERHVTGRLSIAGNRDPEIERRLREALTIARGVSRRRVLAITLLRLRTYITSPDTLDERLELTREMIEITTAMRHPVSEYEAHLFRHEDLLESGDIDGARIEARAMRRVGEAIHSSGILAVAFSLQATHDTADGQLADARESLRQSVAEDAKQGESSNSQNRLGSQLLALRWHEGRIADMEPGFRRALDMFPRMPSVRAALAFIYAETGELDRARTELDTLTVQPVESIPRDYSWWFTTVFASNAAVAVRATAIARSLYGLMLPFAARNANSAGAVSFGSAALTLGRLAASLEDYASAEDHFQCALAFNNQTRQRVWTARTRFHFAEMLLARGAAGDLDRARELTRVALADAHEIGMAALAREIAELRFD